MDVIPRGCNSTVTLKRAIISLLKMSEMFLIVDRRDRSRINLKQNKVPLGQCG